MQKKASPAYTTTVVALSNKRLNKSKNGELGGAGGQQQGGAVKEEAPAVQQQIAPLKEEPAVQQPVAPLKEEVPAVQQQQGGAGGEASGQSGEQVDEPAECTQVSPPVDKAISASEIVFVKLEIAVSINSVQQKKNRKDIFHCLCDFTIIKEIDGKLGQSECEAIADHTEQLPYSEDESPHAACQVFCDNHLHHKQKCHKAWEC